MKKVAHRRSTWVFIITGLFMFCSVFSAAALSLPTVNITAPTVTTPRITTPTVTTPTVTTPTVTNSTVINPKVINPTIITNITGADNPDYQYKVANGKATITGYIGDDSEIVIPSKLGGSPVTVIGPNAFAYSSGLSSVVIPEGVVELQMAAFGFNPDLNSITLPSTLEVIGEDAFINCQSLEEIELPQNLRRIEMTAFMNTDLMEVHIPPNVTSIDPSAFWDCTRLVDIWVDKQNTVYSSPYGLLYKNNSILVAVPRARIGLTIPDFVKEIGRGAVSGNDLITSVVIPNSVNKIGMGAFSNCKNLQSIVVPGSVIEVEYGAFSGCKSLASAEFQGQSTLLGRDIFSGCSALANVKLPANLNKIDVYAFYGCYSLKNIEIPAGVTSIEDHAFADCINLAQIKMPANLKTINAKAFSGCKNLPAISIPEGVTTINNQAFANCTNLSSITIPAQVTQIGKRAFYACTNLQAARFSGNAPQIGDELFRQVASNFKISFVNGKSGWTSPYWYGYPTEGVDSFITLPIMPVRTIGSFPIPVATPDRLSTPIDRTNWSKLSQDFQTEAIDLLPIQVPPPALIQPLPLKPAPAGSIEIQLSVGKPNYLVNAQPSAMDASPLIKDNRVLLPIRYVAQPLGADTKWNQGEQKVTITSDNVVLEFWIGKNTAVVNGVSKMIDENNPEVQPLVVPPGRTLLPLRFISEQLGCDVKWIPELNQVKINYPRATDYLDPQPEPPVEKNNPQTTD